MQHIKGEELNAMRTLLLEELTWPEIKEAISNGINTVIIYGGAVEQHGPHLAESTDTVRAYAEAIDLAERLGNALVAPVIRPGVSLPHMVLPGSISLRPSVFKGIVEDYISSYVHHGFTHVVLASTHGGNMPTLLQVFNESREKYPDIRFAMGYTMAEVGPVIAACEREEGLPRGTCGSHSCDFETSLMLLKNPELVHMECAERGWIGTLSPELMAKMEKEGITSLSANGILGDPTGATAQRGAKYFKAMQDLQERLIREQFHK